jgi:hypothetical protein
MGLGGSWARNGMGLGERSVYQDDNEEEQQVEVSCRARKSAHVDLRRDGMGGTRWVERGGWDELKTRVALPGRRANSARF